MLHHMGRMCFTLPDTNDAEYERKAKAAVEALLKDMEAAQLLQQADAASPACSSGHTAVNFLQGRVVAVEAYSRPAAAP
jgi:hypothetical protein